MKVEFLIAYDDRTWDTEVFEVPGLYTWDGNAGVFDRFVAETLQLARYRKVVGMYLYACPANDQDDPRTNGEAP
jgi:hypothetical protein